MASKYKAEFDLPAEFPSILKAFTREVLRHQPENVYEFGAQYFDDLIKAQAAAESGAARRLSPQELEELLGQLFAEHDADGNGYLDHREFRELLHTANLGLSKREVKRVLAEADENEDGQIEYAEFVPIAIELVQAMYAKADAAAAKGEQEEAARQSAEAHLIHGMPREAIEALMSDVFYKADLDGSGALSRREFHACLREADLGLTRQEINLIMAEVDADGDGQVSYAEFVPLCHQILVEILKDEMVASQRSPSELEHYLLELMASADREGSGLLDGHALKGLIRDADFGLTRLQIHTVLAEAAEGDDGLVEYAPFAPVAADLIYRLLDPEAQASKMEAVRSLTSATGGSLLLHNLNQAAMADALTALFEEADASQSSSLPKAEVKRLLLECELGLSAKEVQCLISAADVDVDGAIMYHSLALAAHRQLAYLDVQHSAQ